MLFDLDNTLQKEQFLSRAAYLATKGGMVELTSKKSHSSRSNAYLHSILGYFALQYGETLEWVKLMIFKQQVNADVFEIWRENELRGRYKSLRSTSSLTQEEMSLCIDRFRDYSSKEAGIYLPTPDDYESLRQIDLEISRNRQYI